MEIDRSDPTPINEQVASELRDRIRSRALLPRTQIPSEAQLVAELGVARGTARRAIALLREEGWVVTLPQRGTFVTDDSGTRACLTGTVGQGQAREP